MNKNNSNMRWHAIRPGSTLRTARRLITRRVGLVAALSFIIVAGFATHLSSAQGSIGQAIFNAIPKPPENVPGESPFVRQIVPANGELDKITYEELGVGGWAGGEGKSGLGFEISFEPGARHAPFVTPGYYASTTLGGPKATYDLANQPTYAVALGPVNFSYKGARVRMTETDDSDSNSTTTESLEGLFRLDHRNRETTRRDDDSAHGLGQRLSNQAQFLLYFRGRYTLEPAAKGLFVLRAPK